MRMRRWKTTGPAGVKLAGLIVLGIFAAAKY
jgi:hypothetical protein